MNSGEAAELLFKRIPSEQAVSLLDAIDLTQYEIYGVEGFLCRPDGCQEARLDLIFDLSQVINLTNEEKTHFIRTFVKNRSKDTLFEVYGELKHRR